MTRIFDKRKEKVERDKSNDRRFGGMRKAVKIDKKKNKESTDIKSKGSDDGENNYRKKKKEMKKK